MNLLKLTGSHCAGVFCSVAIILIPVLVTFTLQLFFILLVRTGRLELPRVAPLDPKSSASTSSATSAFSVNN